MRHLFFCFCMILLPISVCDPSTASGALTVYTSMKPSLMESLSDAFSRKHPEIRLKYVSHGAGKLMEQITSERETGFIQADILWTSEVTDFYELKRANLFLKYVSPETRNIYNILPDFDGSFTPVRLGTLAIVYNTQKISTPPAQWKDITRPEYAGFSIANPERSGTAFMGISLLVREFGWDFFDALQQNKMALGRGSGQVITDTAKGILPACLGVDYVATDAIKHGAPLALAYPPQMLVIPSPAGIFINSAEVESAKRFIDFLLSREGQTLLAADGTLPVRADIPLPQNSPLPSPEEALRRAIQIDYSALCESKEEILSRFSKSFSRDVR